MREFAEQEGYPLILKPSDAAGAAGTYRVDDDEQLEQAIQATQVDKGRPTAVEEFIEGHEGFYDTLCLDGEIVHDWASHYYPGVLEAMRTRWISPQVVTTNRIDECGVRRGQGARQEGHRRPRDHDLGDAHGVVLRTRRA